MKNTQIYKDMAINLIVDSIEKGTNRSPNEIAGVITSCADGIKALSTIPINSNVRLTISETNTLQAIKKQIDLPWYLHKENGLLYYVCVRLTTWLYQQFPTKDKHIRTVEVISALDTIINDISFDEWLKIANRVITCPNVDYLYVRDNIKKPNLTTEQIKHKAQQLIDEKYVDTDFSDIRDDLGSWIFNEVVKANPEFNNDRYYVGLTDWGNEIVNEYIFDIIDDKEYNND